jgi:hypothetical protein
MMARQSERLERETDAAREQLTEALDELRGRLTPGRMLDQLFDSARTSGAVEMFGNLARDMRDNPLPIAMIGASMAWLMLAPAIRGAAAGIAEGARAGTGDLAARAADTAGAIGDAAASAYWRTSRATAGTAQRWTESVAGGGFITTLREQPLLLAALGLAIGAGVGAMMSSPAVVDRAEGVADRAAETMSAAFAAGSEGVPEETLAAEPTSSVEATETHEGV